MTIFSVNRIKLHFITGSTIFLLIVGVLFSYHVRLVERNVRYRSRGGIQNENEKELLSLQNRKDVLSTAKLRKQGSLEGRRNMEVTNDYKTLVAKYIKEAEINEIHFRARNSVQSLKSRRLGNIINLQTLLKRKFRASMFKRELPVRSIKKHNGKVRLKRNHAVVKKKDNRKLLNEDGARKLSSTIKMQRAEKKTVFVTASQSCAAPLTGGVTLRTATHANTSGCGLPHLDPFDDSVMVFFQRLQPLICEGVIFTSYHGNVLRVVHTDDRGAPVKRITYQPIKRKPGTDDGFTLGHSQELPLTSTKGVCLEHDFLQVTAEFTNGAKQVDYHAHVAPIPEVAQRKRASSGIPLNIIIVGLDRNSAGTFQRLLPDAYRYLKDELKAHMFDGFSLLGEGTTPQLTGLLTGKTLEENCNASEARRGFKDAHTVDEWPFIFKTAKKHGYVTMFSEDAPSIGAFWMRLKGFASQPADHYGRTFWSAVPFGESTGLHSNCVNSQPQHKLQLEYLKSLFYSYPRQPKFGFTFLGSLCHQESINTISHANEDLLEFFRFLKLNGHLNNTMLVAMGDHGARFGEIRATLQGRLEERLPFLSIVLPEWFKEKYRDLSARLEVNTKRLITPLDLHATFLHILKHPRDPSRSELSNGISLFSRIPKSRDCNQAGVPEHFCPCLLFTPVSNTHAHIRIGAQASVHYINQLLLADQVSSKFCQTFTLSKILSAVQSMPASKVLTFSETENGIGLGVGKPLYESTGSPQECSYLIQFQVRPGSGQFEAMVSVVENKVVVKGSISRINKYSSQPRCIARDRPHLRPYCLCR